jgi:hypothetical protein
LYGVHYAVHDDSNFDTVYAEFEVRWLQFSQLFLTTAPRLSQKRDDESIWTKRID